MIALDRLHQAEAAAMAVPDDAMVERALKVLAFEDDGAVFPDAYSEEEAEAEREKMRKVLAAALAQQPAAAVPRFTDIEAAARYGWEHASWDWESVRIGLGERNQQPAALAVPADNVTPMRQPRADLARLVESINAAVYANGDGLSVTEAIGALELAKLELLKEQEQ